MCRHACPSGPAAERGSGAACKHRRQAKPGTMPIPVVGLGSGGHAKVVIEILRAAGQYEVTGLLDRDVSTHGQSVLGVPVIGDDSFLAELIECGINHFFIGVGSTGDASLRRQLFELGLKLHMCPVGAVDPRAIVSPSAVVGNGITVMPGAIINACATLGADVIVNTGAIIEHDCVVGDHAHVAPGARLAGGVRLGVGVHIGIGAVVKQLVSIGDGAVVGSGAVVIRDVPPNVVVAGVPARRLSTSDDRYRTAGTRLPNATRH